MKMSEPTQQIVEAFPWDTTPAYLARDNDRSYGQVFLQAFGSHLRAPSRPIQEASLGCRPKHQFGSMPACFARRSRSSVCRRIKRPISVAVEPTGTIPTSSSFLAISG